MEQQDQILGQLQTELRAERARPQETSKQLQSTKKACIALEEDVGSYQRQLRDYSDKVGRCSVEEESVVVGVDGLFCCFFVCVLVFSDTIYLCLKGVLFFYLAVCTGCVEVNFV